MLWQPSTRATRAHSVCRCLCHGGPHPRGQVAFHLTFLFKLSSVAFDKEIKTSCPLGNKSHHEMHEDGGRNHLLQDKNSR